MDSLAVSTFGWPSLPGGGLPSLQRLLMHTCGAAGCVPADYAGPRVLRVSLVSANGDGLAGRFYFEAFSRPAAGHPKNSRIHSRRGRETVDLGCETLDLDWFGDEGEVVVQLVQFSGGKQSRDMPAYELRLPRDVIERYTTEASGRLDVCFGSRHFSMAPLAKQEALQRKRRFQDVLLPSSLATMLFSRLGEEQGLHVPSNAELEALQAESARLQAERSSLLAHSGALGRPEAFSGTPRSPPGVQVTLRLELLSRLEAGHGAADLPYRKASFQEIIVA